MDLVDLVQHEAQTTDSVLEVEPHQETVLRRFARLAPVLGQVGRVGLPPPRPHQVANGEKPIGMHVESGGTSYHFRDFVRHRRHLQPMVAGVDDALPFDHRLEVLFAPIVAYDRHVCDIPPVAHVILDLRICENGPDALDQTVAVENPLQIFADGLVAGHGKGGRGILEGIGPIAILRLPLGMLG
jgi:hypothetical protein